MNNSGQSSIKRAAEGFYGSENPLVGEPAPETDEERLAHGICDVLDMLDREAVGAGKGKWHLGTERAILRGLLIGTAHEGHRPKPTDEEYEMRVRRSP
jgi:hypothetical protein